MCEVKTITAKKIARNLASASANNLGERQYLQSIAKPVSGFTACFWCFSPRGSYRRLSAKP